MTADQSRIYCTWSYRKTLPGWLQVCFGDLDDFLRRIIAEAKESLVLVAPYLSSAGFSLISGALSACADRLASVRIVTQLSGEAEHGNRLALKALMGELRGSPLLHRTRVLSSVEEMFIHAKLVLVDDKIGYIGSANLSSRGLQYNLEIGVALSTIQVRNLFQLIDWMESHRELIEHRDFR